MMINQYKVKKSDFDRQTDFSINRLNISGVKFSTILIIACVGGEGACHFLLLRRILTLNSVKYFSLRLVGKQLNLILTGVNRWFKSCKPLIQNILCHLSTFSEIPFKKIGSDSFLRCGLKFRRVVGCSRKNDYICP